MATQAEKLQVLAKEKKDRSARMWAWFAMFVFLVLSLAANVLTAWESDVVSKIIAGVPPLSLFITSMLFERMVANKWINAGMTLTILVSLSFSWYHIAELAYDKGQPLPIALFLPLVIDVPMLFAGTVIIGQAKAAKLATLTSSTSPIKAHAAVTTPAKVAKTTTRTSRAKAPATPATPTPATVKIPRKRTNPTLSPSSTPLTA